MYYWYSEKYNNHKLDSMYEYEYIYDYSHDSGYRSVPKMKGYCKNYFKDENCVEHEYNLCSETDSHYTKWDDAIFLGTGTFSRAESIQPK